MLYLRERPHSIKIHPAVAMPFHDGKQRPLSNTAREIYKHLWNNATFKQPGQKASSCFITHQKIAEKLHFNLSIINRSIYGLIQAKRLKRHKDGYLVLIKEGAM